MESDVLIVAGGHDTVAVSLQKSLEKRGRRPIHLDGPSAAGLFTVRPRLGASSVEPNCPMFVRASAWDCGHLVEDADERFLRAEAYATFWAAAALTDAPVINRPPSDGMHPPFFWATIANALGSHKSAGAEIHASGPEMLEASGDDVWGENVQSLLAPVALLPPDVPLRARKVNALARYEIVTVVGARAFPATQDVLTITLGLPDRSTILVRKLRLHFATVSWAIDEDGATPVRVNALPGYTELQYNWDETIDALCEDLSR